jgi:enoyl-CoA hydratase/carnithine racemase
MEIIDKISWEIRNGIGIITLDNPPENYLIQPEFVPLEVLKQWTSYEYLKGILICGAGKHFSGGGKLDQLFSMIRNQEDIGRKIDKGKEALSLLESLDIPVVAAIQGICFGGGLEIALACHIRVCSENTLFAFPEINQGLLPGLGGTVRFPETAGFFPSFRMMLSGDMIGAEEAMEIKLADYLVPRRKVVEFSFNLMQKMTRDRPVRVIHAVMRALRNARHLSREEAMREETRIFCELAIEEARNRDNQ